MDRTPHSTLSVPHYNQRHTAARLWHTIIWHTILTHCRLWTKREEKRSSTSTKLLFRSPGFSLASSNCTVTSHFSQVSHCPHNEIGPKSYWFALFCKTRERAASICADWKCITLLHSPPPPLEIWKLLDIFRFRFRYNFCVNSSLTFSVPQGTVFCPVLLNILFPRKSLHVYTRFLKQQ